MHRPAPLSGELPKTISDTAWPLMLSRAEASETAAIHDFAMS
jgi:hypothetical protein